MRFEDRSLLDRGGSEVAPKQADGEWRVAAGSHRDAGAIHQCSSMIKRARFQGAQRAIHLLESAVVTVKPGQVEPRAGAAVTDINRGAIFLFRRCDVFVLL